MDNERRFYTYAYLREDRTPYYIGKGSGKRAFNPHIRLKVPQKDRILFLKTDLTEEEAFKHEIYMIAVLGRKDLGTGILRNLTDGGEGSSGISEEARERKRQARLGKKTSEATKEKLRQRKYSKETIGKMRKAALGRKHTEKTKEKLRRINLGKGAPKEVLDKMKQINLGRKRSEETKEKIRQTTLRHRKEKGPTVTSSMFWWVSESGETCRSSESPGPEWRRGRK
jgi:hypothetical protein